MDRVSWKDLTEVTLRRATNADRERYCSRLRNSLRSSGFHPILSKKPAYGP